MMDCVPSVRLLLDEYCYNYRQPRWPLKQPLLTIKADIFGRMPFLSSLAGALLVSDNLLQDSKRQSCFIADALPYELNRCNDGSNLIAPGAPAHWRQRRQATGAGAFAGLTFVILGKLETPGADTMSRLIRAGGGVVLKKAPRHGADVAIVNSGTPARDATVHNLLAAGTLVVVPSYIIHWLAHPWEPLEAHHLHGSPSAKVASLEKARAAK